MPFANTVSVETTDSRPDSGTRNTTGPSSPIRVVFVIDNMRVGGTELNAVRTAAQLDRQRFELRVVCLGEDGPLTERYRALGVSVENMPIHSFYGPSMVRSGRRFVRMLRREHIDIVHAHDVYSNIFAAVWSRRAAVPVLITSRRWWSSLPNWKLKLGSRFAVSRSTAVLANSSAVAKQVMSEAPWAEGKVWTITNFVEQHAFGAPNEEERQRLREGWKTPAEAVVIGCVARFDPVKDHAGLLRAFALLRARQPHVYLVLIGDGAARPALEALVNELDLSGSVYFAGEQRARSNLHRGFDISVLASRSEGFPNSLVEAMAAGNPVVATAVGGNVDAVVNEATGLLVSPGDPDELASAMSRLAESAEIRTTFGRAGALRAIENFDAAGVVSSLERMYEQLLSVTGR